MLYYEYTHRSTSSYFIDEMIKEENNAEKNAKEKMIRKELSHHVALQLQEARLQQEGRK